jgi:hypothetical protein
MGKLASRILTLALVCAVAASVALADHKSDTVTFSRDITVNGTLVKAGTYKVQFDDKSGELTITRGKKEIAKVSGHLEAREQKARETEVISSTKDDKDVLTGISFGGDNHRIVLSDGSGEASK